MTYGTKTTPTYQNPAYSSLPPSLTIPETVFYGDKEYTVTSIGNAAFYGCTGLTSIDIPDQVTSIGRSAFNGCTGITSVTLPATLESIGNYAFKNSGLTRVVCYATKAPWFDANDIEVFTNPGNMTLYVPNSAVATYQSKDYWKKFGSIIAITEPAKIGYLCYILNNTDQTAEVTYENSTSPRYTSLPAFLSIPQTVSYNNKSFMVTSIGENAFDGCSGLASAFIPASVSHLGENTFSNCNNLTTVTCFATTPPTCSGDVMSNPDNATLLLLQTTLDAYKSASYWGNFGTIRAYNNINGIYYKFDDTNLTAEVTYENVTDPRYTNLTGEVTIPSSIVKYTGETYAVTSIGSSAFFGCIGLTSITIPNSVTSIGSMAFDGCTGLASVNFGNSVASIGGAAFYKCSSLTSVELPNSLNSIGGTAFAYCTGLTSVVIPGSVTQMESLPFGNNSNLTTVTCLATTPPTCSGDVVSNPENAKLIVPKAALSDYQNAKYWKNFGTFLAYKIGGLCYNFNNTNMTAEVTWENSTSPSYTNLSGSVTIPETVAGYTVTSIGEKAFASCSRMTSISIPTSMTAIGENAFYGCSGLSSVIIPDAVASIGYRTFAGCSNLASIVIPNTVELIGKEAFSYCMGLTSVTLGNSVTSIGQQAFEGCTRLTSIDIPNSVTSIGQKAFDSNTGLTSVTIPSSVNSIGNLAFYKCI